MNKRPRNLLFKGLEEEVYTGTYEGEIVGMSHKAKEAIEGIRTEPDSRNTEFVSPPVRGYDEIACLLMTERQRLRDFLKTQGNYTLIPGATLSTGDSSEFHISDPENKYYQYIRDTYHTRVVTASAHINIGIDDPETIIRASRLLRMEAALYLALTANSPFLDNEVTGYHSQRWAQFPHTPSYVPLFESHADYVGFVEKSVANGEMQNTRHLWISARPNGEKVPEKINRVELRVCDRIDDPRQMMAVTALMEARVLQLLEDPTLCPMHDDKACSKTRLADLMTINDENNMAVMKDSLNATVRRWEDGRQVTMMEWLEEYVDSAEVTAKKYGFGRHLKPVREILAQGNPAMRWLKEYEGGESVKTIIQRAILEMEEAERVHREQVCSQFQVETGPNGDVSSIDSVVGNQG